MDLTRIDLKMLECFMKVAELGSFTKASIALGIDQPAVSRKIGQLEVSLHQRLFNRHGRGIRLTDEGRIMLGHSTGIFKQLERMHRDLSAARQSPVGKVVIGMTSGIGRTFSSSFISLFQQRFPHASLELIEGRSGIFPEQVLAGSMDIAILQDPAASPLLTMVPLYEDALVLVSLKNRSQAPKAGPVSFKSLARLPLILPGKRHAIRQLVDAEARKARIKLNIALEIEGGRLALELIHLGYGYTILPVPTVEKSAGANRLQVNEIVSPKLRRSLKMIMSRQNPATYLVRETFSLIRDCLVQGAGKGKSRGI